MKEMVVGMNNIRKSFLAGWSGSYSAFGAVLDFLGLVLVVCVASWYGGHIYTLVIMYLAFGRNFRSGAILLLDSHIF